MIWEKIVSQVKVWIDYLGVPLLGIVAVLAGVAFFAFVPGAASVSMPFWMMLLGIAWGQFMPYLEKALDHWRQTGEWLPFERKYWIAPLGAFLLQVIGFTGAMLTFPGLFERIAALDAISAFAIGRAGKEQLRDLQKLVEHQQPPARVIGRWTVMLVLGLLAFLGPRLEDLFSL